MPSRSEKKIIYNKYFFLTEGPFHCDVKECLDLSIIYC